MLPIPHSLSSHASSLLSPTCNKIAPDETGSIQGLRIEVKHVLILTTRAAWNSGAVKEVFPATSAAYPPLFYMYLKDPHAHLDLIEGLESCYRVEECSFNTIFGSFQGHRIYYSRKVAERSRADLLRS